MNVWAGTTLLDLALASEIYTNPPSPNARSFLTRPLWLHLPFHTSSYYRPKRAQSEWAGAAPARIYK